MICLPQPDDVTSLVLRADFTDDAAWNALKTALHTWEGYDSAAFISDPRHAGLSLQDLVDADNAARHEDKLFYLYLYLYLYLADSTTMTDVERPLLAVDLAQESAAPSECRPAGTQTSWPTQPSETWTSPSSPTPPTGPAPTAAFTGTDVLVRAASQPKPVTATEPALSAWESGSITDKWQSLYLLPARD